MKWFKNLKIAAKLIVAFLLIAVLAGAVGIFGILSLTSVGAASDDLFIRHGETQGDLGYVLGEFNIQRNYYRDMIIEKDAAKTAGYQQSINESQAKLDQYIAAYEKACVTPEEKAGVAELKAKLGVYNNVRDAITTAAQKGDYDQAYIELRKDSAVASVTEAKAEIDKLVKTNTEEADKAMAEQAKTVNNTVMVMIIIVAAAVLLSLVLGIFLSRMISKPIKHLSDIADKVASGDLDITYTNTSTKDEVGQLTNAMNSIVESLNNVLSEINTAAEQVATGTGQVSEGSQSISQGATEQASSIEELNASVTQIASQTKENALKAVNTNELASGAKENAVVGNQKMKDLQKAMTDINESSANISKIIKVIDDIAFQTNILALNAAVEAARAGAHGKGFAVVAEEVRNLAARSANAAKETTALIEGSIKKAEAGTKIADDTAVALESIVTGVEKAVQLVGEIAYASNEQATGIAQINKGIEQMSQVVQTNSANAEEAAAAAEELSGQAELLKTMVKKFRLKSRDARPKQEIAKQAGGPREKIAQVKEPRMTVSPKILLNDSDFGKY